MRNITIVLLSVSLVSCTSAQVANVASTQPPGANSSEDETVAGLAPAAGEVVQIDIADASGPEIVCTKVTRPGTRMVVGETCAERSSAGVNAKTREEIQREISGEGWASGWKTREQIEVERRTSLGGR